MSNKAVKDVFGGLMLGCGLLLAGVAGGAAAIIYMISRDTAFPVESLKVFIAPTLVGLALIGIGIFLLRIGYESQRKPGGQGDAAMPGSVTRAAPPADPTSPPE